MLQFEYLLETEMNPNYLILLDSLRIKLEKAISHLDYSYRNIDSSILQPEKMSEQELANWESLTARFSRVSEIFLQRYLRTWILSRDPGFEGSFRDILNIGVIFVLLYAAIKVTVGQGGEIKKLIAGVILFGVMTNFSLFLTKAAIDVANVVALEFYNQMCLFC